jgi:uncharacterized membrane protein
MNQRIFLFAAMGCLGITAEIFFTAITAQINAWPEIENWRLKGESYIWMFPIYGIAGWAFPIILPKIQHLHFVVRTLIYAIGILTVEFITGWMLDVFTGQCPWEYTTGWHVMGYIRLDYTPFWMLFGGMVERVIVFLQSLQRVPEYQEL